MVPKQNESRSQIFRERVKYLLDVRWAGNQRRMASDLHVSQAAISNIVRGMRGAGKRFLVALANHHDVNAAWLWRGEGEPVVPPDRGSLPIALGVLPGLPEQHTELLSGERHPVAEAYERTSRYWLPVTPTCPLLNKAELALLAGDLLLMDSDRKLWEGRLEQLVGHIFGAQFHRASGSSFELGRLVREANTHGLDVGKTDDHSQFLPNAGRPTRSSTTFQKKPRKVLDLEKWEKYAAELAAKPPADAPIISKCSFELFGICVYLARSTNSLARI